ncbi:MAG: hypothetical protein OHK0015_56110 [Chloroflexi bacterium OHK40]
MQASTDLRNIITGWFESVGKGDPSWTERHVSLNNGVRLVGTDPSEVLEGCHAPHDLALTQVT